MDAQGDHFLLSASYFVANFPDGSTLFAKQTSVSLRAGTPLGDEIWIVEDRKGDATKIGTADDDSSTSKIVRLILIPPKNDWRLNQTYGWKLDSAWMSAEEGSWLHWNVESYINSDIQVQNKTIDIFACEELVLHFRPLHGLSSIQIPTERIIFRDLRLGLGISEDHASKQRLSPCSWSSNCSIVDGAVVHDQQNVQVGALKSKHQDVWLLLPLIALLPLALFGWRRYRRFQLYQQLAPASNEDLILTVEQL